MRIIKLTILFIVLFATVSSSGAPKFEKGILDLTKYKPLQSTIKIEGEVEFYWNKLLTPKDFSEIPETLEVDYVKIPKSWTSYEIDGENLPQNGYATYRFWIKLNSEANGNIYGIKVPSIFTSYKLWIDGKLITEAGKVATSKEQHKPKFNIGDFPFAFNSDSIEVVIQVSNYSHRRAGLPWPMQFGTFDTLKKTTRNLDILNLIVIGIILVIGLNHINMYLFRRKDVSNLYFGILSLVMILRNITTGDRILAYIFPNINWEFLLTLDNFSGYGTIPFFALFFYHLYKEDFQKWLKNLMVAIGVVVSIVIFVTPAAVFGKFNLFFELYLVIGGLYLTFGILLVSSIRGREGAFFSFVGMFLLYATAIADVLSSMGITHTPYLAAYGLVTFMLLQSFNITSKSARAINKNEELSNQLAHEKNSLEKNIEERTSELKKQHDALLEHQQKEKVQAWINKGLAKINNVLSANKNDFSVLSRKVLTTLVKYMGVKMGVLYVMIDDEGEPLLERVAQYGLSKEVQDKYTAIKPNQGLVGAVYADNELKIINDIPDEYCQINSGLGSSKPNTLLIAPLSTDEAVFGVLELARFDEYKPEELEFIKKITYSIAISLNNVRMNERNVNLIQQFQEQAEEIQEKEEKMRESLHELEYYREQYDALKKKIEELEKGS
ncbi:MAG: 7TM diverse intracellular signaling domain-containing protein [Bacteroidales bacterium]